MASCRSLSAFPFASATLSQPHVNTEDADVFKRWVWMVRRWKCEVNCSVLISGTDYPVVLEAILTAGEGLGASPPSFADEKEILDYRGMYAQVIEVGSPFSSSLDVNLGVQGSWGDVFDGSGDVLHAAPGSYSWELGIILSHGSATTTFFLSGGGTASVISVVFDGISDITGTFYESGGGVWTGNIDIYPDGLPNTGAYWGYDGRYDPDTGAAI